MSFPASNSPKKADVIEPPESHNEVIVASKSALLTDLEMLATAREALKKKGIDKSRNADNYL